jgi:hypothetical protein
LALPTSRKQCERTESNKGANEKRAFHDLSQLGRDAA